MNVDQLPLLRTRIPGPKSRALARQLRRFESRNVTYVTRSWPIFWERAAGANVWDVDGNRYVDLTAAFGVAGIGHSNPRIVAAIKKQSDRLLHAMGDVHPNELKVQLARELAALTFGRWTKSPARVLFANSGAEAVEAALKTAVMHTKRPGVIAFQGAYHGLTYGALAATAREHFREPFREQLGQFVTHVPFGVVPVGRDRRARRGRPGGPSLPRPIEEYGAVLVEPIQARGGINVPPDSFLADLRKFCDKHQLVLIFDEIYTGFCRTGKWFAGEHWNVTPDVVCVGKAMSGGLPIAACVGRAPVMDSWPESEGEAIHTSTFLGNPLCCATSLASVSEMKRLKLETRSRKLGEKLIVELSRLASRYESIREVRGKGLMIGVEFVDPSMPVKLMEQLLTRGWLVLPEGERSEVLGLTPPLTISQRQLDCFVTELDGLLEARAAR